MNLNTNIPNIPNNNSLLVEAILDIGEMLLMSGAEVSRVEDTMARLGNAYEFERADTFSITSSIVFTVKTKEGEVITQTRRIKATQVDMEKLENINALSRGVCLHAIPLEELQYRIRELNKTKKYSRLVMYFVYAIASAAFSLFFGGSPADAVASMLTGSLLYLGIIIGNKIHVQTIVLNLFCSFTTGLLALCLLRLGVGTSFEKIIIGNIMLLIPGISLTTSLRDMIKGDLMSGLLVLCEALLKALAIAVGFAIVMIIKGA